MLIRMLGAVLGLWSFEDAPDPGAARDALASR